MTVIAVKTQAHVTCIMAVAVASASQNKIGGQPRSSRILGVFLSRENCTITHKWPYYASASARLNLALTPGWGVAKQQLRANSN